MEIKNKEFTDRIDKKLNEAVKREEHSIFGFLIRNYRITYLLIIAIFMMGIYSMFTLPREAEPEIKIPYAVVTTVYLGATPKDMEDLVTNKIEDEIKDVERIKKYESSSGQGFSSIFVEFEAEADMETSMSKLKDAVDQAVPSLPGEAETPTVQDINFSDIPLVTYSLVGDYSDAELKKYADMIQARLEGVKDVSKVPIRGGREREFQVIVDQSKLTNYKISASQIISAIQASNFSLPAGDIAIDGYKYSIRVDGKFVEAAELKDIAVSTFNGSPVFLKDLADIKDGYKEQTSLSKIAFAGDESPRNTISFQLYKKTGGNIINIVESADKLLDKIKKDGDIPESLAILKTNDNSKYIKDDLGTLGTSGLQTMFLITLILFLVLSFRGAIITALSVPFAFLMSFYFLKVQDMTLNSMVLFSLVLSLGLMVDNAIVIIEGISEYIIKHKKSAYEAALLSVWNFKWAVIAGTMTTVSAFLPLLLVSGIMGEYMGIIPKTLTVTLLSSLFVALVLIPTLASRFIKVSTNGEHSHRGKARHKKIDAIMAKFHSSYSRFLTGVLESKRKRRLYLAGAWVLFILAIMIPASGLMKIEMFPKIDFDYFNINIELPVGSTLEETEKVAEQVEKIALAIPEMESYVMSLGATASLGFGDGGQDGGNLGSLTINLPEADMRTRKSFEIAESIRPLLAEVQGGKVTLEELQAGPPTGSPIEIRIFGDDSEQASRIAEKITKHLEGVDGAINVRNNLENATGEFTFTVDRQKANFYGLNVMAIASNLRSAVYGTKASVVNAADEDIDITVKYDPAVFKNANDLENLLVFTPAGETIPLKQVAKVDFGPSLLSISHRDGKNIATVSSDLEKGANAKLIMDGILGNLGQFDIPEGISVEAGGETEDIQKSFTEIFLSLFVALILITFILVLQFNSFKQPFIIMFTLPLALIGVILGLNLLNQAFSITAFIGIVSLAGIVVNDAIVLVDKINKNLADGMEFVEAIVDGGITRMQPIFLTTITTIAGILPLIFANEMWLGLSLTITFGLSFSTILTLFMVPNLYYILCKKDFERTKASAAQTVETDQSSLVLGESIS